jgi:hypothetical protein
MTPFVHAQSSCRKWGGVPSDYIHIHEFFDETKQYTGDWTHRALRHHAAGVQWAIERFGHCIEIEGKSIPVKLIAEQHVTEDCGFIPTVQDWLCLMVDNPAGWMVKVGKITQETELQIK